MTTSSKILKSRRVVITLAVLALAALVWLVLGWWLDSGPVVCLIATCVVLTLLILYLVLEQAFQKRQSERMEKSIWQQSEEQKMGVRPDKHEEIDNLRQQLLASIQQLKKSRLGNGRPGNSALYALPWYMIIGPPAAGKTTAIRNSGLEFPFGRDHEVQGIGGTRNCDWWFSNSAIILDTAGRYTTEEEDREEWTAFLDILKRNRRRQPVNGVLVCISIDDLSKASRPSIDVHARTIRKRIDELIEQLGVRFPVYLVFTKCDLVNGFVEFFQDLNSIQRDQIWGFTLTGAQQQDPKPGKVFEEEFELLYDALLEARLARLSPGIRRQDRGKILAFPLEFRFLRENLTYFVAQVFQRNPYQDSPIIRGFYFTSGTQEGVPIDRVVQSIAQAFGLDQEHEEEPKPEAKSYFIKDLFTEIIVPDDTLVRPSSRAGKSIRYFRLGAAVAIAAALVLLILVVTQAYFRGKATIDATASDIELFKSELQTSTSPVLPLRRLLNRARALKAPPFFAFGMDRSAALLEPVERLFFSRLKPVIQKDFLRVLENRMLGPSLPRGEQYDDLKAYLLLTKETARLYERPEYQRFVIEQINRTMDTRTVAELRDHIEYFGGAYAAAVQARTTEALTANDAAIATARLQGGKLDIANLYEGLKRRQDIPSYFAPPPFERCAVKGIFTAVGESGFEQSINEGNFADLGDEQKWVWGYQEKQLSALKETGSQIAESIRNMYYQEYAATWWDFIQELKAPRCDGLPDAMYRLKILGDLKGSPLKRVFEDVAKNTHFEKSTVDNLKEQKAKQLGVHPTALHPIEQELLEVQEFVSGDPQKGTSRELDALVAQVAALTEKLEPIVRQGPGRGITKYVGEVISGNNADELSGFPDDIRRTMKSRDNRIRGTVTEILMEPVRTIWHSLLEQASVSINDDWNHDVYEPYSRLAQYYPFDLSSKDDAPLDEVSEVFAENGSLWKFADDKLGPFLTRAPQWDARTWQGEGLDFSQSARDSLNQAAIFRASLFRGQDPRIKVYIRIDVKVLPKNGPSLDKVMMSVGDVEQSFLIKEKMSGSFTFDWPGLGGASIKLAEKKGKFLIFGSEGFEVWDQRDQEGHWALFRLIGSSSRLASRIASEANFQWTFKNGAVILANVKTDKGFNNPFAKSLRVSLPRRLTK